MNKKWKVSIILFGLSVVLIIGVLSLPGNKPYSKNECLKENKKLEKQNKGKNMWSEDTKMCYYKAK